MKADQRLNRGGNAGAGRSADRNAQRVTKDKIESLRLLAAAAGSNSLSRALPVSDRGGRKKSKVLREARVCCVSTGEGGVFAWSFGD